MPYSMYTFIDKKLDYQSGAATLLLRLDEEVQEQANFWQRAIQGNMAYFSQDVLRKAQNIKNWYEFEKKFSYSSEKYKIKPEHTAIFQKFKEDPNYIFKNLVEMLVRKLLKDSFSAKGIEAKLYTTSDADDVLAGVDIIVETQDTVFGIDVCCSENSKTVNNKTQKSLAIPIEYNRYKGKNPVREIPRVVYPIPRAILGNFLKKAMKEIAETGGLVRGKALNYFQSHTIEAKKDPFESLVGEYKVKLTQIL